MRAGRGANSLMRSRVFAERLEAAIQLMGQEHPDVKKGADAVSVGLGQEMQHLRARWDAIKEGRRPSDLPDEAWLKECCQSFKAKGLTPLTDGHRKAIEQRWADILPDGEPT